MDSLDELERLVATSVRVGKTEPMGKELWGRCSRVVTDRLGEFYKGPGSRFMASLGMTFPFMRVSIEVDSGRKGA